MVDKSKTPRHKVRQRHDLQSCRRGFGFIHHSRTIFCCAVSNPNLTIRDFCIAVQHLLGCKRESAYTATGVCGRCPRVTVHPGRLRADAAALHTGAARAVQLLTQPQQARPRHSRRRLRRAASARSTHPHPLSLITSRFVNGNTVSNFPTHGQLSAAQGNPTNCLNFDLPYKIV
jgi:hypothetical protein